MLAAILAAGAAALLVAGCGQPRAAPTLASCRTFGVHAIERHEVVRTVPGACAGLTRLQVNESVAEAVRASEGTHGKAVARAVARRDARYLAGLVSGGLRSPGSGAEVASGAAASGAGLRIAALVSWMVTAAAGTYLLTGLRRRGRAGRRPPGLAIGHAAAATAGLGTWAAFAAAGESGLAWAAAGLAFAAAGLGMAVLVGSMPERSAGPPQSGPGPRRVLVIAVHGMLAAVTMALVLYAAVGG
jgi:hypothetical protein